jgi:two-component system NtrC family sensor kinase
MKLLNKIIGLVLFGIIVLLAIDGYFSIRRERELFDIDMALDALTLGYAMREPVINAWKNSGEEEALKLIQRANRDESRIQIRWVWLDVPPGDPFAPRVSREQLDPLKENEELSIKQTEGQNSGYRYSYLLCPTGDSRKGALELSESLSELDEYTSDTIFRIIILAGVMVLLSWVLLWILGRRFVGRPLSLLVAKTRRVGIGDFSGDVILEGNDELSQLAGAMNEMCEQLDAARVEVREETEAKIEALEQLRHTERLAVLGRLASGIAHELGTPLNVVAGRAKLIATEDLNREEIVDFSRTIEEQSQRMTSILRQLLDYARRRPAHRSSARVADLLHQVVNLINPTAKKSGVSLDFKQHPETPSVNVDPAQLQQVFMNLVMNGIQAMSDGGVLQIELDVERTHHPDEKTGKESEHIVVRVTDQGEGISAENLNLIFDPFFTTKEVGQGTGLGLSVAQGIVEDHGGWIQVTSEPGAGSCFTVYLPVEEQA